MTGLAVVGCPLSIQARGGRGCRRRHAFRVIAVRTSRGEDSPGLQEIERLAGEQFRAVGLDTVADNEPASVDELSEYAAQGRSWVAVDAADQPVGFVLVDEVDGNAHVQELNVRPDHQGQGVGRALLDRVRVWATETGRSAISLMTFAEVPWNRPHYERLGFKVFAEEEIGPELSAVREVETAHGLDPAIRVCMRLVLDAGLMERP
jgi:GNAT superfamily N-acetyltransferase